MEPEVINKLRIVRYKWLMNAAADKVKITRYVLLVNAADNRSDAYINWCKRNENAEIEVLECDQTVSRVYESLRNPTLEPTIVSDRIVTSLRVSDTEFSRLLYAWLSRLMVKSIRERVFEPAYQDALADFLQSQQSRMQFILKVARLVASTWGAVIAGTLAAALRRMIPAPIREWWFLSR